MQAHRYSGSVAPRIIYISREIFSFVLQQFLYWELTDSTIASTHQSTAGEVINAKTSNYVPENINVGAKILDSFICLLSAKRYPPPSTSTTNEFAAGRQTRFLSVVDSIQYRSKTVHECGNYSITIQQIPRL